MKLTVQNKTIAKISVIDAYKIRIPRETLDK